MHTKQRKHAYLIIAHNEFFILESLVKLLDYKNNDIYIHVDKKVKHFDFECVNNLTKHSRLFLFQEINVMWGGYSQIECELFLLEKAVQYNYSFIHIISGVDLPIRSQFDIHQFFDTHNDHEFVEFDDIDNDKLTKDRIRYYYPFQDLIGKNNDLCSKILRKIQDALIYFQKILKVDRTGRSFDKVCKGSNWISITNKLAKYIVDNNKIIKKQFKYSFCADEIFIQTLMYHSEFFKNNVNDNLRLIDWTRGKPYTFHECDFPEIERSEKLFARKFSTTISPGIVKKIFNKISINKL